MNEALFNTLPTFREKVNYIALELANVGQMAGDKLDADKRYEVLEPYIQGLMRCTEVGMVEVPEAVKEMFEEIKAGKKINAIKIFRGLTGAGLKEAKDEVERVCVFNSGNGSGNGSGYCTVDYWEYEGMVIYNKEINGDF